jgi:hypothetical protein
VLRRRVEGDTGEDGETVIFMRPPKKECQALHALKRLQERYNLVRGKKFLGQIVGEIKGGKSKFIYRQSNRVTIHKVILEREFFVVYDSDREAVVTFLTQEMVDGNNCLGGHAA